MERMQLEREIGAENLVTQIAGCTRLFKGFLEALVDVEDLAVDVVVAGLHAHRVGRDRHAFDDDVRVVAQDVAILERPRLALIRIAHEVLRALELPGHEAPLQSGRKTRTTATTQTRSLDFGNHLLGREPFLQDFAQRLVSVARFIVFQVPAIGRIQTRIDLRLDMPAVKAGFHRTHISQAGAKITCPHHWLRALDFSSSISASSFSAPMKLHIRLLLTSSTGASPQAPRHSLSLSVNRPSAVVSL